MYEKQKSTFLLMVHICTDLPIFYCLILFLAGGKPHMVSCDFEMGIHAAISIIIPHTKVKCCIM